MVRQQVPHDRASQATSYSSSSPNSAWEALHRASARCGCRLVGLGGRAEEAGRNVLACAMEGTCQITWQDVFFSIKFGTFAEVSGWERLSYMRSCGRSRCQFPECGHLFFETDRISLVYYSVELKRRSPQFRRSIGGIPMHDPALKLSSQPCFGDFLGGLWGLIRMIGQVRHRGELRGRDRRMGWRLMLASAWRAMACWNSPLAP